MNENVIYIKTCSAPINIAIIKYWGKKDIDLNIPLNSSLSITLNQNNIKTITSIAISSIFKKDRFWLNNNEIDLYKNKKIIHVINQMKIISNDIIINENIMISKVNWEKYHLHIVSINTFPTASGLASSASGFACLVGALKDLFNTKETYTGELTAIARQGSGSACRSLYGGLVKWEKGMELNGKDSIGKIIVDEKYWSELQVFILITDDNKKNISSTNGMISSEKTSDLLKYRIENVVDKRIKKVEKAFLDKDFETLGNCMMQDSNQFHAICLDTFPPIIYLNETSKSIISFIHEYNNFKGKTTAAYTFDAGPNAVLLCEKKDMDELMTLLLDFFPPQTKEMLFNESKDYLNAITSKLIEEMKAYISQKVAKKPIKKIYQTCIGDGIRSLSLADSLIDPNTGLPKHF